MATDGWEAPKAPEATPQLTAFIALLARDLLPMGYMEHILGRVTSPSGFVGVASPELTEWAERVAKTLVYDARIHGTGVGS